MNDAHLTRARNQGREQSREQFWEQFWEHSWDLLRRREEWHAATASGTE